MQSVKYSVVPSAMVQFLVINLKVLYNSILKLGYVLLYSKTLNCWFTSTILLQTIDAPHVWNVPAFRRRLAYPWKGNANCTGFLHMKRISANQNQMKNWYFTSIVLYSRVSTHLPRPRPAMSKRRSELFRL